MTALAPSKPSLPVPFHRLAPAFLRGNWSAFAGEAGAFVRLRAVRGHCRTAGGRLAILACPHGGRRNHPGGASMRVLVACEFSGVVREAFRARGHDAWSCDLLPSERPGYHLCGDVLAVLGQGWDLAICFPPCTYLCNSGVRWLYGKDGKRNSDRWDSMFSATEFFNAMLDAPIARIAVENPIPHGHAMIRKYDQIIQPWQHGHGESKATCLWLRGLPLLVPTKDVPGRQPRVHHASPGPDRWKERSRTLPGIAKAFAEQWG